MIVLCLSDDLASSGRQGQGQGKGKRVRGKNGKNILAFFVLVHEKPLKREKRDREGHIVHAVYTHHPTCLFPLSLLSSSLSFSLPVCFNKHTALMTN